MSNEEPTRRNGFTYICAAKKGEIVTPECIRVLMAQFAQNGGSISEAQARQIVEEHQPHDS